MLSKSDRRGFVKISLTSITATVAGRKAIAQTGASPSVGPNANIVEFEAALRSKIGALPPAAQVHFLKANGASDIGELSVKFKNRYPGINPETVVTSNKRLSDLLANGKYSEYGGAYESRPGHDKIPFEKIKDGYQSPGYSRFSSLEGNTLGKPRDIKDAIRKDFNVDSLKK